MTDVNEWLDSHWTATLSQQHARRESARVAATFVAGIAAALTGVAQQATPQGGPFPSLGVVTVVTLGLNLLATLVVLLLDKVDGPKDPASVLEDGSLTRTMRLIEVRRRAFIAVNSNDDWFKSIKPLIASQLVLGVACWVLAVLWLLGPA